MKIGIYGGTFNPPHNTHVCIARQAVEQLGLDRLFIIPSGDPPHKPCFVSGAARLELAKIAFDGIGEVLDTEILRGGKSYTSDTVADIRRQFPQAELYLVIGGDSLEHFHEWHEPQKIADEVTLAVAARIGCDMPCKQAVMRQYGCNVADIVVQPTDVSSSEIRQRYQFGLPVDDVPAAVDEYVRSNGMYAEYRPLVQRLRSYLTDKRFWHTYYVVKRGQQLCGSDISPQKAFVACLLHDCAKYMEADSYARYGFVQPPDMPQSVVHAFLGEKVAQADFGITDDEVLRAIRYHCTAKADMSPLEMLVYVADKTEETRPYDVAHLLGGTLRETFVRCLEEANSFCLTNHGKKVYYLTKQALDYYVK